MSSRIFQSVISQMKEAATRCIGVIDDQGFVVACSELSMIGSRLKDFRPVDHVVDSVILSESRTYKLIGISGGKFDYAVFVEGTDELARSNCVLAAVAFNEAKTNYEEKHNKAAFVKNIISDNFLPGDVYVRAKELHFATEVNRTVLLVRQYDHPEMAAVEIIQNLFPDRQHDFVLSVSEMDIVVIKELTTNSEDSSEAVEIAKLIEKTLSEQLQIKCIIGVSTPARHLRELADRYKETQVAIDVGRVFNSDKSIMSYDNLGLGRIIYQLPTTLCEMYLQEVFKKNPIESLDEDTLETINKFFENNLNVSETSRKLYVHRNTLVYRLEKIKKLTGLDLREFDHAIVFKVAMMVKQYLDSLNQSNTRRV
jgi:carbohydrate diacid regulator